MNPLACNTCTSLTALGVKSPDPDAYPWTDSPPAGIDELTVFAPGSGHSTTVQIRRCEHCRTLYRYRYHSEYDVSGSWDEYFFWRLGDEAQQVIGGLLLMPVHGKSEALASALHNTDKYLREDASLLLWILADAGETFTDGLLLASCEALADENYLTGNYAYRGLLSFAYRGVAEAGKLKSILQGNDLSRREDRFSAILLRECAGILSGTG